uniref:VWFA domain-containing protein n=1 Tax=Oryzias latipes TaxID=8090 RepID=A0A3P9JVF2_ORYLA
TNLFYCFPVFPLLIMTETLELISSCFGYLLNIGKKDIIFLIDGSASTDPTGFAHVRDFLLKIVQQLNVQPDQVRVGVVQYADRVKTDFSLNSHNNKAAVINAIQRLRNIGGRSSELPDAIDYIMKNEFQPFAGARPAVATQHLVIITAGRSTKDVNLYGQLLKSTQINSIAIGAGRGNTQLIQIASTPKDFIPIVSLPNLQTQEVLQQFIARLAGLTPVTLPDGETPCNHLFFTLTTAGKSSKQADIVFLVDGSINLGRSNFEAVMQFINSMIDNLYDDESSLQISLAQYAADVTDAFFLNTYDNKENIVTAIEQVQYRGGPRINTGAAIRHIQNVHFTKERGSRMDQGVPQILMVVTGGASADDSRTASLALQRKGIRVYAVGAGNIQTELEGIASESTTVARSSNFQAISDLVELLMPALTEELKGQKLCVTESLTPRSTNFEQALLLEFGRGFKYTRPLKLNIMDLDYELLDELVSLINQSFIYCLHKHVNMKFFSPHRITL